MKDTLKRCITCERDYLIIPQEQSFYSKKGLPIPTACPNCRQKRRQSLRNERRLYNRECDKCARKIISTYASGSLYVVYCPDCFWKYLG